MGIQGLLPLLKSIHKNTTLKKFAGQTIGIDGYGWLHRGAVACAIELALDKPTTKYVDFAMSRVRMLLDFGITPYLVFDGDSLPSKAGTNNERRKRREEAKTLGLSLYKAGKTSQAYLELQKATAVTPYMTRLLIEELKKLDVQYVVAPYEADAQLAYLEQKGIINGILSEDSDLLVYGAKRLITKLNQYGECVEIERRDFALCKEISLAGWTDAMFRRMAILSGCDYLPNIEKMGLKTAYRFVRKYKDTEKIIRMIAFEGKLCVPQGYLEKFKQAELTFIHHRVFCPIRQEMIYLTDLERGMSGKDMPYLGEYVEPAVAIGVACGDLNPKNKEPLEVRTAVAARPQLKDNRRQTFATPSDLKKSSSIDNFFKPQRTPLQELDPNSLTPSPSQQRLLERHRNASWEPRTVASAPQLRRAATAMAENSSNNERRAFLARASTISNYQPPKRQRLCSENEDVSPSKEIKHSPFFTSGVSTSPLDRKKARSRKAKRDFDVWSDDSVDEVLLGLIDDQDNATNSNDLGEAEATTSIGGSTQFETDLDVIPQSSPVECLDESQGPQFSSTDTQTTLFSTGSDKTSQNTVIVNHDEEFEAFEDLLEYHVRMQNEKIAKTFVSQSPSRRATALDSISSPRKRVAASSTTNMSAASASQPAPQKQPNIPLGSDVSVEELATSSSSATAHMLKTFMYQSSSIQTSALKSLGKGQSDTAKVSIARAALVDQDERSAVIAQTYGCDVSDNAPNPSTRCSTQNMQGSEDALVPDSEDEGSIGNNTPPRAAISLKSFVYTG